MPTLKVEFVPGVLETPRQRQVRELVKTGLTTKQIAQKLFVTEKTVKGHLTNIYRAWGVRTRFELIVRLHERPEDK